MLSVGTIILEERRERRKEMGDGGRENGGRGRERKKGRR